MSTPPPESVADCTLAAARTIPAPRARVFEALVDPARLARWWGPKGFTNTFHVCEPRAGGAWRFDMHAPDGKSYANESTFLVVERDSRVVIRHDCAPFFVLEITLLDEDGGTRVGWRQVFEDAETCRRIAAFAGRGNEENLERLAAVVLEDAARERAPHEGETELGAAFERLEGALQRFDAAAKTIDAGSLRDGWAYDREEWSDVERAALESLDALERSNARPASFAALLAALALDEEAETLADHVADLPRALLLVSEAALAHGERDARWQLAARLGARTDAASEALLLRFAHDPDEYVRRRALLALGERRSSHAEALALRAWESDVPHARIAALSVLASVRSPRFAALLALAHADPNPLVAAHARELARPPSPS